MIHADLALAIRLEKAAAALGFDAVRAHQELFPQSSAEALPCGDGVAIFLTEESPLTQIRGAGTAEFDLDEVERFFADRMAPLTVSLTPFAPAPLWTLLSRRDYEFGTFENTLVRRVVPEDAVDDADVELAGDRDEWSRLMAEAFFGEVTGMGLDLAMTLHSLPTARNLIVRADGVPAAGAQLDVRDGVGVLQCDGTLPVYRESGFQTKLIRARLAMAARAGCDLVTVDTFPGTQSQRNYERQGFRVAYTKVTMLKPCF